MSRANEVAKTLGLKQPQAGRTVSAVTFYTTPWADERFPAGAELVLVRQVWYLVLWTNDGSVIGMPDANVWGWPGNDFEVVIPWQAPNADVYNYVVSR